MERANMARCALLSVADVRSSAVERVRSRGEETIEGIERREHKDAPAAYATGVRCDVAVAGYTLTGRALAEPERLCVLEHTARRPLSVTS